MCEKNRKTVENMLTCRQSPAQRSLTMSAAFR